MTLSAAAGFVLSAISAVANGTFAVVAKTKRIRQAELAPLVLNCYCTAGVCLSASVIAAILAGCTSDDGPAPDGGGACASLVGDARLAWSWLAVLGGIIFAGVVADLAIR